MRKFALGLAVLAMVVPAFAATDYFETTGDGSFATHNSEGYANVGSSGMARIGKTNQNIGWLAWDAKDKDGVQTTATGDNSGLTMAQFKAANGGVVQSATLYINVTGAIGLGNGTWAIESLRSGNQGVLREDGSGGGATVGSPANNIGDSSQPYAFASMPTPFAAPANLQGGLKAPYTPWITPSNSNVSAYGWTWTSGINAANANIVKNNGMYDLGWDGNRSDVGGWALQYLLGYANNQAGSDMARANAAGQIVNNDGAGNPVLLSQASAVAGAPRPGTVANGWYAIPLSLDLANAIVSDPELKGIVFNQFLKGTTVDWGRDPNNAVYSNVSFYTKDQNSTVAPFLALTVVPEPATMVLLALGGLALIRRRQA